MLGLDVLIDCSTIYTERFKLPLGCLPFDSLAFSGTAAFTAFVSPAIFDSFAATQTQWGLFSSLMTDSVEGMAAAATGYWYRQHAG